MMKQKTPLEVMPSISISDFRRVSENVLYSDEDIITVSSLEESLGGSGTVRSDCFIVGICLEGILDIDINYKSYRLNAGDSFIILPNTVVGYYGPTEQRRIRFAAFSNSFISSVFRVENSAWSFGLYLRKNPVFTHNNNEDHLPVMQQLAQLISTVMTSAEHAYKRDVMRHIYAATLLEACGLLSMNVPMSEMKRVEVESHQSYHVLRRFSELLSQDQGIHRTVSYYADALCYSSKYFSTLIKQASGRTAMALITEHCVECIRYKLLHSDKSIREISDELEFPNQSFFGKYVKKHLGVSPVNLRRRERL